MPPVDDTLSAVQLTPPGRGAVATIRVEGPRARDVVARLVAVAKGLPLIERPAGSIAYARWQADPPEDVVVGIIDSDTVEIHGHGGRAAVNRMLAGLAAAGCRIEDAAAWLTRSAVDPIVAEAELALASAWTLPAALILLAQRDGALRRDVQAIDRLLESGDTAAARERLAALVDRARWGMRLAPGFRVVLAGRPNAGKSSLLNALVGYQRAIVYDEPGTTRDALAADTALDGWPVRLIDTAGLRDAAEPIESEGVRRAENELAAADLVLLVTDATAAPDAASQAFVARHAKTIVVRNKCDLLAGPAGPSNPGECIDTSALTGAGLDALASAIVARLGPAGAVTDCGVPFTARQQRLTAEALGCIEHGRPADARRTLATLLAGPLGDSIGPRAV